MVKEIKRFISQLIKYYSLEKLTYTDEELWREYTSLKEKIENKDKSVAGYKLDLLMIDILHNQNKFSNHHVQKQSNIAKIQLITTTGILLVGFISFIISLFV